jgi:photosystem II stability/assembly factor-like uncharacterized protein
MGNVSMGALYADGDTLYAGTLNAVYKSTNQGSSWSSSSAGLPLGTNFQSIVRSGAFLVAGGDSPGIWRSSNNGASWSRTLSGVDSAENVYFLLADADTVYAAIGYPPAVGISTDNGATWIKNTSGLPTGQTMTGVAKLGGNLFATHNIFGLHQSTDGGTTWTNLLTTIGGQDKNAIITAGTNLCVGTTLGIYTSTDGGTNWTQTLTSGIITGLSSHGADLFAVGVLPYTSTDGGLTWTPVDDNGLPGTIWNTMQFTTNYAFVNFLGVGTYRRPLSQITEVAGSGRGFPPGEFRLGQNYPNPFNPATSISYVLPERGRVRLAVFNTLGEEVAVLVNDVQEAGHRTVAFNAGGLPSGVYSYRLTVGVDSRAGKMLLLK